jgi:hypothetical protein
MISMDYGKFPAIMNDWRNPSAIQIWTRTTKNTLTSTMLTLLMILTFSLDILLVLVGTAK